MLAIVLPVTIFSGCTAKSTNSSSDSATVEDGKLIIVTEAGFAPYEYYDGQDVVGVNVDIAKELAAITGKELVIKDIAFDSIIPEINSGKADLGAAGMSITSERLEEVDFTIEYATLFIFLERIESHYCNGIDCHCSSTCYES